MKDVTLEPYLFFTGTCREAMDFYKGIFGGDLYIQTIGEAMGEGAGERKDKIMHAYLKSEDASFMGSDGTREEPYETSNISLSLSGPSDEKLTGYFEKLSQGGKVTSPLKKEIWDDTFGTLTDKFGVDWMVNITAKKE